MPLWDQWKQGFDVWETKTAQMFESMLKSQSVLQPMGSMLTAGLKMKATTEKMTAQWWSAWGLPTRREQERTLHTLNQIQSRLIDLEERLADLQPPKKKT